MPPRARLFPLLLVVVCGFACAQEGHKTDLQREALVGPVKSVIASRISEASPEVKKRISFFIPPLCQLCEYDRDGNRITNGQIADGDFFGDRTVIQRNSDGMVERMTTTKVGPFAPDASPVAPIIRYELAGPFGIVYTAIMQEGKELLHETKAYDARGNLSEVRSFDSGGLVSRDVYKWTDDGQRTELDIYLRGDVLFSQLTWDPETDVNRYTCFDLSGALLESWTTQKAKVLSFWQASEERGPCNTHFMYEDNPNGDFTRYTCERTGECRVSHSYSSYLGPGKQNIRHTDFRDPAAKLMWASDYQYDFDSKGNWTHRKVWVTIAGDPGPILFAEDARTISYWDE